jgi:uncharacterized protein (TIGR02466 family)
MPTSPNPSSGYLRQSLAAAREHQRQGRLSEAERMYRQLLGYFPGHPELLRLLGILRYQNRDADSAVELLRRAIAAGSDDGRALEAMACILGDSGREEEGIGCFRELVAAHPQRRSAFYNLGMLLMEGPGRMTQAAEALERAVALDPGDNRARGSLALALLKAGEPARSLEHIDSVLARRPGDVHALAHKIAALSQLGDQAGIAALVDLDGMIHIDRFESDGEFETPSDLNEQLARHILEHPSLGTEKTTTNGLDTGEILTSDEPAIRALVRTVEKAVAKLEDSVDLTADHPFLAGRPRRWGLSGWGVRMWSGGFQVPHYHKDAWISGVYYVRLPPTVKDTTASQQGWIEFGRGADDLFRESSPPVRRIRPEEGRVIAFPSYFWHRTLPFTDSEERLCISFNVVAEEA